METEILKSKTTHTPKPKWLRVKLPTGKILKGEERKIFETNKIKLDVLKSEKIIGIN